MEYKVIEISEDVSNYKSYEPVREKFIISFQNKVNELLNKGYILAGGINISFNNSPHTAGSIHFAQALIKE